MRQLTKDQATAIAELFLRGPMPVRHPRSGARRGTVQSRTAQSLVRRGLARMYDETIVATGDAWDALRDFLDRPSGRRFYCPTRCRVQSENRLVYSREGVRHAVCEHESDRLCVEDLA